MIARWPDGDFYEDKSRPMKAPPEPDSAVAYRGGFTAEKIGRVVELDRDTGRNADEKGGGPATRPARQLSGAGGRPRKPGGVGVYNFRRSVARDVRPSLEGHVKLGLRRGRGPIRVRNCTESGGPGRSRPAVASTISTDPRPARVLVNESFARRFLNGGNPVSRRVRYASPDGPTTEPWLEIVGMVRDMGMTPTNFGEAPYVFTAASAATASPLVMGVRTTGDPAALVPAFVTSPPASTPAAGECGRSRTRLARGRAGVAISGGHRRGSGPLVRRGDLPLISVSVPPATRETLARGPSAQARASASVNLSRAIVSRHGPCRRQRRCSIGFGFAG